LNVQSQCARSLSGPAAAYDRALGRRRTAGYKFAARRCSNSASNRPTGRGGEPPGRSSAIGFEAVAKAQPDGYTIGYGGFPLATNQSLLARVPYDVNKDFRMVILTNISPNLIAITPTLPVNSVQELIAYAKRNPDQLLFGTSGSGGTMHLSVELFKLMTERGWCTCRTKECSRSSPKSSAAAFSSLR
jgi:hypothetical protein